MEDFILRITFLEIKLVTSDAIFFYLIQFYLQWIFLSAKLRGDCFLTETPGKLRFLQRIEGCIILVHQKKTHVVSF